MSEILATVVREEWGRLTALLLARFRRLDLVEDGLADAVEQAARRWPGDGAPDNPAGWLLTAARRRVLDRLRHEAVVERSGRLLATGVRASEEGSPVMADPGGIIEDDLLRLALMCSHPALAPEAASALTLRLVLGVPTPEIARLFLTSESTMAARLTRAKKKIAGAGIPFATPDADAIPERLDTLAQTTYLAFTAGYAPGSGADLLRADLAAEAIRLNRTLLGLCPHEPVLVALHALMLLQHSRRDARVDDGRLVLLPDQDRRRWHHDEIREAGELLLDPALAGPVTVQTASYVVQARIATEHATAATSRETRWEQIVALYDLLLTISPSPGARLARAVAVAECSGPAAGLAALDGVQPTGGHREDAVRAELLTRAGDRVAAIAAFDQAIAACANLAERAHLVEQRTRLAGS